MRELADLDVFIVDCQTTGASPEHGAVLELGWGVARGGGGALEHLQAHWITLPEDAVVSAQVRRLTGFDERRCAEPLAPEMAWQRMRACMDAATPMPAAIHFARFELAFLRDWALRFGAEAPFPLDAVCVHALACRLYPNLPRRSLRALAGFLGHGVELERRCLGHVEATAFIWRRLCADLGERGVRTWPELAAWLEARAPASPRSSKRRYPLPSSRYRALPDEPGVYRFLRSNGDVLYVGKARSLRKRVASHFKSSGSTEHALEMLTQANDVQVTTVPTPLEAALLENETIKALRPPYNVQLASHGQPAWFASPAFDSAVSAPDDAHRIGPLPSAFSLTAIGALIALLSGEAATRSLRARSVGTADYWAPEAPIFVQGLADFAARHLPALPDRSRAEVQRALFDAARKLVLAGKPGAKSEPEADPEELEPVAAPWDPERVARHLERALAQSYQLLRRARWLCLLYDSVIVYREPDRGRARTLLIRQGEVVEARDTDAAEPLANTARVLQLRARKAAFDRARYDRLRVLTTELKRVRRDGGEVALYAACRRRISDAAVDAMLRLV